jgi:hypothetical protein
MLPYTRILIMACVLKARIVDPEKQSLLCNGCVTRNNGVTVGSGVFYVVPADTVGRCVFCRSVPWLNNEDLLPLHYIHKRKAHLLVREVIK